MAAKETNLITIKEVLKVYLNTKIEYKYYSCGNIILCHPLYNNGPDQFYRDVTGKIQRVNILQSPSYIRKVKQFKAEQIEESKDLISLGYLLNVPYRLQFLEIVEHLVSLEDLALYLAAFWCGLERVTMIQGVKKAKIKKWLKQCDKEILMGEEERKLYDSLGDRAVVFRGATDESRKNLPSTMTWTVKKKDAVWYAKRYVYTGQDHSYLYSATIDKKHIYACMCDGETFSAVVNNRGLRNITLLGTYRKQDNEYIYQEAEIPEPEDPQQ